MEKLSKVLIVDDEPIGRQLLEAILFPENFDLYYAENGKQAFEKALLVKPDLILMDVMMPGIDGFEVCKKLRDHELLENVPVILITALDDRDSMIKGLDAGADDYISKPFDRVEVLAKVKNITQLDRYKRILNEKDEPKTKEKNATHTDANLHYAGLIQKSLLPSHEFVNNLLPNNFIIIKTPENISSNIFWITEKKGKIIIVLCNRTNQGISDVLMNILGVTITNKIINKKDNFNTVNILDDLRITLQKYEENPENGSIAFNSMNLALCIFDRENHKLQYSGLNIPLFILKNGKAEKIEGENLNNSSQNQNDFNSIDIKLSKHDGFYIFSNNLLKYIEEASKKSGNKDILMLLNEQQNSNIKIQESFFIEYIDKVISATNEIKDIILAGVRI